MSPFLSDRISEETSDLSKRGAILPVGTENGQRVFAYPQWLLSVAKSLALPGDVVKGKQPSYEEIITLALDVGMLGAPTSLATSPSGALGMFGGKLNNPAFEKFFEGSKAVTAGGEPKLFYRGTHGESPMVLGTKRGQSWWTDAPNVAETYSYQGPAYANPSKQLSYPTTVPAYLSSKTPLIVEGNGKRWSKLDNVEVTFPDGTKQKAIDVLPDLLEKRGATTEFIEQIKSGKVKPDTETFIMAVENNPNFDSVIFKDIIDIGPSADEMRYLNSDETSTVIWTKNPEQAKSPFNKGTFSPNEPDILKSSGTPVSPYLLQQDKKTAKELGTEGLVYGQDFI